MSLIAKPVHSVSSTRVFNHYTSLIFPKDISPYFYGLDDFYNTTGVHSPSFLQENPDLISSHLDPIISFLISIFRLSVPSSPPSVL
ncbi:hypothetical protein TNCV_2002861 [Trichonephila clavipes]|nr:hypothetical protein TNCV_2002861 [Trichonephila clavipes]